MTELFSKMPQDLRKSITDAGLAQISAMAQVAGPNAAKFIEAYLGKSPTVRNIVNSQGGSGIIGANGINFEKLQKFLASIGSRVPGDPRLSMQTVTNGDEDMAEGMVRLQEKLSDGQRAAEGVARMTGNLNDEYRASMGLGEAFSANVNKVKKSVAGLMSSITQGASDALSSTAKSPIGAASVVGGAALTAAGLAGLAMKGIGGALGGTASGIAQTVGAEEVFGSKVTPVYVTNFAMFPGGSGLGDLASGAAGAGAAGGGSALLELMGPVGAILGSGPCSTMNSRRASPEINKGADASKTTSSAGMTDLQISVLRKALDSDKVPESRHAQVEAILKDYDQRNATNKILGTTPAGSGAATTSPGAAGGKSQTAGGASTYPTQHHKVTIESKDPRLKVNIEKPPKGASF